jgi:uncharacterized protein YciI
VRATVAYGAGMWIVELAFTDAPERLAARPAHRDRLTELHRAGTVRLAGPFADDDGALIVLDVPDRQAVDDILAADPYFAAPGVTIVRIRGWEPFLQ